jgi:hypothetical protein
MPTILQKLFNISKLSFYHKEHKGLHEGSQRTVLNITVT